NEVHDLNISARAPEKAMEFTLAEIREGRNVVSVTGNVLRDYLTDFFPILGVGGSSQMLSQVPLLGGGLVGETGSGGTAPKHVDEFREKDHLRWSSLGEFFALEEALRFDQSKTGNAKAGILADTLHEATGKVMDRTTSRIDTRLQHLYLARAW